MKIKRKEKRALT